MTHTTPPQQQTGAQARKNVFRSLKACAVLFHLTAESVRKVGWTWPKRRWQLTARRFQFGIMSFSRRTPPKA